MTDHLMAMQLAAIRRARDLSLAAAITTALSQSGVEMDQEAEARP